MSSVRHRVERPKFLPGFGRPIGLVSEHRGNGKWAVRFGHGPRIPMRDANGRAMDWWEPEFLKLYGDLRHGKPVVVPAAPAERKSENSLAWLIGQFRASKDWPQRKATAANYNSILRRVEEKRGDAPFLAITPKDVADTRDAVAAQSGKPMAEKFVTVMRVLFAWACKKENGALMASNPAVGVSVDLGHQEQHHTMWTAGDCAKFEKRWERGTTERLAYALLLGTGQRRSDVVRMGPAMLTDDGEVIALTQTKTGKDVACPMTSGWMDLRAEIAAAKVVGVDTFLVGANGKPMTADAFGRWFGAAAKAAGLADHTAHGLRRSASAAAVEAGYTAGELQTVFGYTLQQAEGYIAEFSREKVARGLARKAKAAAR